MPIGPSRGAAGCQLGGTVGEHPYHRRAFGGDPVVDPVVRPAMGKNGGSKASMGLGRGLFLQFVAVRAVCSKTGPDRSLCQLKRTARSDRFDRFMLFVQDRSRPVSVPSEMNCMFGPIVSCSLCSLTHFVVCLTGRKREAGGGAGAPGGRGARGGQAGGPADARPGRGVGAPPH